MIEDATPISKDEIIAKFAQRGFPVDHERATIRLSKPKPGLPRTSRQRRKDNERRR